MKAIPVQFITIKTPRSFLLSGLFLGPVRPKRVFIFVHGLTGNIFSRHELTSILSDKETAVLVFNNRGSGLVNGLKRQRGSRAVYSGLAGQAHEIFIDCVDDLDGAVELVRSVGVKEIYLVGHSTGCQKSVYYLARRPKSPVRGAVLLAPVSDYSSVKLEVGEKVYARALSAARRLVRSGRPHSLLPESVWGRPLDAQRFLSLYTPESAEEIFSYASGKTPTLLRRVRKPLLVVLAGDDQFHDRPAEKIAAWFQVALQGRPSEVVVVDGVRHDFSPAFLPLARLFKNWAAGLKRQTNNQGKR